ncbi:MAG: hypothetical protein EZS28_052153, partial [Streblomastix strix]
EQNVDSFVALALDDSDQFFITTDPTANYELSDVLVIFKLDDADKCDGITTQTPPSVCPCPTDPTELVNDPRYGTTCLKPIDSTSLYYFAEQMNDDLVVTIDTANEQDGFEYTGKVKINNLDPLFKTSTPAASSFQIFTNEEAEGLNAFYELFPEEAACGLVYDYYASSLYTFLGFASYAYQGSDIAPSITALIANSPNRISYTDISITPQELYYEKSCGGVSVPEGGVYYYNEYYTSFAIEKFGILDFECVPNTIVPQSKVTSCTNTSSSYLPTLKGYRIGAALDQSVSNIKELILRFGP